MGLFFTITRYFHEQPNTTTTKHKYDRTASAGISTCRCRGRPLNRRTDLWIHKKRRALYKVVQTDMLRGFLSCKQGRAMGAERGCGMKEVHQCSSCGGFCKKSGCERANVEDFTPDEYLLQSAALCLEEIGSQMLHDGVPIDATHPKRIAMTRCYEITNEIAKRLEKS